MLMFCESCGRRAPLREAEFGLHLGLIFVRYEYISQGRWCSACIHKTFWMYTPFTLLFGWWGIVSFFATIIVSGANLYTYATVFLRAPLFGPVPETLTLAAEDKLAPYRDEMFRRLLRGETMQQVAEDIGRRAGVTPEDVKSFYSA